MLAPFSDHVGTSHVAIAGHVLKELPARLRPAYDSASNSVVTKRVDGLINQ